MRNSIVCGIAYTIRHLPNLYYAIIIDGAQDISGQEQKVICLHYIDDALMPYEQWIGL